MPGSAFSLRRVARMLTGAFTILAVDCRQPDIVVGARHDSPLVVGLGEEDFASLTPELAQKYEQLFHQPEAFLKLGNRLLVLPVPDEPPAEKPRTKPPAEHDR